MEYKYKPLECSKCKSKDLLFRVWVNQNDEVIDNPLELPEERETFCNGCKSFTQAQNIKVA